MIKKNIKCTDEELISWFKENYEKIKFISKKPDYQRMDRKKKIIESVDNLTEDLNLCKQRETLKKLWKYLVGSAIIYLKSKDKREKHHDDGDYGLDELGNYFDEFCKFEKSLYGSSEYYRDHLSHLFEVFLLGEYLLRGEEIGFDKLILGSEELLGEGKISAEEKEAMWCIAALTHDLGYPLEKICSISESSRKMMKSFETETISFNISQKGQTLNEYIIKFIASTIIKSPDKEKFFIHIQPKFLWKLARAWEQFDHGVSSALLLFKKLVYFLESDYCLDTLKPMDSDDAKQFLIRNQILKAIAVHHCNYVYHLHLLDFSFFLRIIDEMQEWGRPRLKDLFEPLPVCKVIINNIDIKRPGKKKILSFTMKFRFENKLPAGKELKQIKESIKKAFISKVEKFIEILRSAVGGGERDFVLEFTVIDHTEKTDVKYYFLHEAPDKITLKKNGKETSLEKLKSEILRKTKEKE